MTQPNANGLVSLLLSLVLSSLGGCLTVGTAGCAQIKPTTKFGGTIFGWEFVDTKDNDIEIIDLDVSPGAKSVKAASIIIRNNSSDVIDANVAQMMAFVEQQRAANEGITAAFAGLAQSVQALGGALSGALARLPAVKSDAVSVTPPAHPTPH
jgi:hypothetical protein